MRKILTSVIIWLTNFRDKYWPESPKTMEPMLHPYGDIEYLGMMLNQNYIDFVSGKKSLKQALKDNEAKETN